MKNPHRSAILIALTLLAGPAAAQVHQWTPESPEWTPQLREVWEAEKACIMLGNDALEARLDCQDPDYYGWGIEWPITGGWDRSQFDRWWATHAVLWTDATPLHVLVQGDLAVVQVVVSQESAAPDGSTSLERVAWTDILRRSNGKWRWISDHGHLLGQ